MVFCKCQITLSASWETCTQIKKHHLDSDMEQWTASNWERSTSRLYIVTLFIQFICRVYHAKCGLDEAHAGRNINNLIYADATTHGRKQWGLESLDKGERGEWKVWLKAQHSNTKIMKSSPITSWQIDGKTMETATYFLFLGSKITLDSDCSHEIKRCLLFGWKLWPT